MRMSTVPQMKYVGNFQLYNNNGIGNTNANRQAVVNAAIGHYVTNTQNLSFGFYLSAQVTAQSVAYWAVNRSTALYATTVSTNGPTVPASSNYDLFMPAIYAQAYQGGNGKRYVVFTNKGSTNVTAQIFQDGFPVTNQFLETFVTGSDPSATNTSPQNIAVSIQTQTATNPVTISQYSVVRLEWSVFNVPRPALAVAPTNGTFSLHWSGLTNVVYNVQSSSNLTRWSTLAKVSSAQTNFTYTDLNTNALMYYRLLVP